MQTGGLALRLAGKVRPVIDSIYTFDKAVEAIEHSKTCRARGKIIVTVKDEGFGAL